MTISQVVLQNMNNNDGNCGLRGKCPNVRNEPNDVGHLNLMRY